MPERGDDFVRVLGYDCICLTNNAAELELGMLCLERRAWLFAGSDRVGAAAMYIWIGIGRLDNVDLQTRLADFLGRIAAMPQNRLDELLSWNSYAARPDRARFSLHHVLSTDRPANVRSGAGNPAAEKGVRRNAGAGILKAEENRFAHPVYACGIRVWTWARGGFAGRSGDEPRTRCLYRMVREVARRDGCAAARALGHVLTE